MNIGRKAPILVLAFSMLIGMLTIGSSAGGETVRRVLFVNAAKSSAQKSVPASSTNPEYMRYTVNADGKLKEIKVLKEPGYDGVPSFLPSPFFGVFDVTFNASGYVSKTRAAADLVQGYNINAMKNGKIILGAKETEYTFAKDARVFVGSASTDVINLEIKPWEIQNCWDGSYWLRLNGKGEIATMYMSVTSNLGMKNKAFTDNIKKFDAAWGPSANDGRKMQYTYFKPVQKANVKYPLVIWFHYAGAGQYDWQSMFDISNNIAKFASDAYQAKFTAGGAYVMVPRDNETWVGLENGMAKFGSMPNNRTLVPAFFAALNDFISKNPDIDTNRIYIGGCSLGAVMTWFCIREHPEVFAAAFPNAPSSYAVPDPSDLKELSKLVYLPLWQVHSISDSVCPIRSTQKIMPFFQAAAARTGTDTRFLIMKTQFVNPNGTPVPNDHLEWIITLNNMLMNDGSLYLDKDGIPVKSTLIDWFNGQSLSANQARKDTNPYTDIDNINWAYPAVKKAFDAGIVLGVGGEKFSPDDAFSTANWLTALYRIMQSRLETKATQGANWMEAARYLNDLLQLGFSEQKLNAPITRQEMAFVAAMVLKYKDAQYKVIKEPIVFSDAGSIDAAYKDAVTWFVTVGGINGKPNGDGTLKFDPEGTLKRSEAVQVVSNIVFTLQAA